MARMTDIDALLEEVVKIQASGGDAEKRVGEIILAITNAPTVEVVRCKECKHWKPVDSFGGDSLDDMQRIGRCPIMRFGRREKDFCCEGERKDNG